MYVLYEGHESLILRDIVSEKGYGIIKLISIHKKISIAVARLLVVTRLLQGWIMLVASFAGVHSSNGW